MLRYLARRLPPVQRLVQQRDDALAEAARLSAAAPVEQPAEGDNYPPGHYHSPLPDMADIYARADRVWQPRLEVPGIDIRDAEQLALVEELATLARDLPVGGRYQLDNHMFGRGDALVLYAMLRLHRPPRVVEVGSGFSSALMLDTADQQGWDTRFTFIDPNPERLHGLLTDADRTRTTIIEERAELLDPKTFDVAPGELLFIDSSHVSKIGSDVNFLFLEVLPTLPAGVLVHIHDIPWPFEYWRHWIDRGRYWNEAYLLRALLTDNPRWRVLWFSSYMMKTHPELLMQRWPEFGAETGNGASIWLHTV
ncbi:class I SAM-dependent methyltransferase [Geodermatophilus sp. SYSU D00691]